MNPIQTFRGKAGSRCDGPPRSSSECVGPAIAAFHYAHLYWASSDERSADEQTAAVP